jgi:hypothetical protein
MGWPQLVFGCLLAVALAVVAGVAGWRELRALRRLREAFDLSDDERRRQRQQGRRRLLTCILMALLAVLLLGGLAFLEARAQNLADQRDAEHLALGASTVGLLASPSGQAPLLAAAALFPGRTDDAPLTDDQRFFARLYGYYWISFLLILLALMVVTAWDLLVLRLQAQRERRQLVAERKDMIERQLGRLREERNGRE